MILYDILYDILYTVLYMILLYYWFVGVCEDLNIRYLWILALLLVAAYFIISYLINIFEFNEKKKLKIVALTQDKHYQNLMNMVEFYKKSGAEVLADWRTVQMHRPAMEKYLESFTQ